MQPEQLVFEFNTDCNIYCTSGSAYTLSCLTPYYTVVFYKDERVIGKLDWNEGPMKFEGDADDSAQLFFDNIIKRYFQTSLFELNPTGSGWQS
jgi:hypothetical protein